MRGVEEGDWEEDAGVLVGAGEAGEDVGGAFGMVGGEGKAVQEVQQGVVVTVVGS